MRFSATCVRVESLGSRVESQRGEGGGNTDLRSSALMGIGGDSWRRAFEGLDLDRRWRRGRREDAFKGEANENQHCRPAVTVATSASFVVC